MKKLIVLLFTIVLLLPDCAFARKRNYNSLCSTLPASAPVEITLSEIGYKPEYKYIVQDGYNKGQIITNLPQIYLRHAVKNKSGKIITSYSFNVKIYRKDYVSGEEIIFSGNINKERCRIRPGISAAETWYQTYNDSREYHNNIRNHLTDHMTRIVYELYSIKYSDGTSEIFNF